MRLALAVPPSLTLPIRQLPGHLSVRLALSVPPSLTLPIRQLPGHLSVRLQSCQSQPPEPPAGHGSRQLLLAWIQRLQFKMGQIELQSSAAAQFYTV